MFDYLHLIPFLIVGLFSYSTYYFFYKRNKFKNAIFNISACSERNDTKYYLMVEIKHGQNIDARKLSKTALLFAPNNSIPFLKNTYKDYETAEKSLHELKNKYLCHQK